MAGAPARASGVQHRRRPRLPRTATWKSALRTRCRPARRLYGRPRGRGWPNPAPRPCLRTWQDRTRAPFPGAKAPPVRPSDRRGRRGRGARGWGSGDPYRSSNGLAHPLRAPPSALSAGLVPREALWRRRGGSEPGCQGPRSRQLLLLPLLPFTHSTGRSLKSWRFYAYVCVGCRQGLDSNSPCNPHRQAKSLGRSKCSIVFVE